MLLYERLLRTVGSPFKAMGRLLQNITHVGIANCAVLELRHGVTFVLGEVIDENRDKNNKREKNNKKKNNDRATELECSEAVFNNNSLQ
jgi:hypothetical protein